MDDVTRSRPECGQARFWLCVLLLAALVLAPAASAQAQGAAAADLVITLSAGKSAARDEGVTVHVTVANPASTPRRVLRWWLPDGSPGDSLFQITRDGVAVAYVGPLVKRRAPTAADYVTLAPGESRRYTVDLAPYYDFALTGRYVIAYDTELLAGDFNDPAGRAKIAARVTSNAVTLQVEGRPARRPAAFRAKAVIGSNAFAGCSVARQNDLIAARIAADDYAILANDYLDAARNGVRYTTWFGSYLLSRYTTVGNHFEAIGNALQTVSPMQFDCSCTEDFFAYVFGDEPYVIYLCNAFWSAPLTGTDSKAGTLIHELSHFTVLGGTEDHAYGHTAAKNLAISDPARAVMNADSHEYFSENTPAQEVTVPDPPTALVAQAGSGQASVAFQPGYQGGALVTNYQYSTSNGPWTTLVPADAVSPVTVPSLADGGPYSFRLRALNAVGPGAASAASNEVTLGSQAQADLGVAIARTSPATAQLHAGLAPESPLAVYRVQVTNLRPARLDDIVVAVRAAGALRDVVWTCSIPAAGCGVAGGTGAVATTVSLNAAQTATLELTAAVQPEIDFAEIHARAALPFGVPPLAGGAEVRASLIEAASASGVHRSGFE